MRKEIVGDAVKGAQWLRWGILEHAKQNYGKHAVENGDIIIEIEPEYVRVIMPDLAGFQLWPRYGNIVNLTVDSSTEDTYNLKVTEFGGTYIGEVGSSVIYDRSPFPMTFDAVRGTFVAEISKQSDPEQRTAEAIFNGGFMANCFWTDGKDKILNWRGTPNRHFAPDTTYDIPGVSNESTTFGTWIYEGGEQLIEAPDRAFVTGAFYKDNILYCISYLFGQERVHSLKNKIWTLLGERVGGSISVPCFISSDSTQYMSGDGVLVTILEDSITQTSSTITSSGSCAYGWGNPNTLVANGVQTVWAELEGNVTITTTASSSSITDSGGSSTTKDVPLKYFGNIADRVAVDFTSDVAVYNALYGSSPPSGSSWFTAKGWPNGQYCSISWAAISANSCNGPDNFIVSANGIYVAGHYTVSSCKGVNFYLEATTDTGAKGQSGLFNPILDCSQDSIYTIVPMSDPGYYTFIGRNSGPIQWSVTGGEIIGSDTSSIVRAIPLQCSGNMTLNLTLMCGSASLTLSLPDYSISISGPSPVYEGAVYTVNNARGDVTWSFDGGDISSSGMVSNLNGCGIKTITATDSCGKSATFNVAMIQGQWVQISEQHEDVNYTAYYEYTYTDNHTLQHRKSWTRQTHDPSHTRCSDRQCNDSHTPFFDQRNFIMTSQPCSDGTTLHCPSWELCYNWVIWEWQCNA